MTAKGSEQGHQARFWADEEADLLPTDRQHVIRDSKTPSGAVPISGLRGPIITDALYRTFKKRGLRIRYVFTIDDYDPMDSQSLKEQAAWAEHMGKPFAQIPSPEPSVASDFARYHASAYLDTFATLGIRPEEIHWIRCRHSARTLPHNRDPAAHLWLDGGSLRRPSLDARRRDCVRRGRRLVHPQARGPYG